MAKNSKTAKKSTKTAVNKKGKLVNLNSSKAATKKAATKKKAAPKKAVAKKTANKKAAPKKVANKKKSASPRKAVTIQTKKTTPKKVIAQKKTGENKKSIAPKKVEREITEVPANLPPVEEKSPQIVPVTGSPAPGMDIKSLQNSKALQNEAVRHYDNHNIRLSNKKGGIKPSGKKPLW